MKWAAPTAIDCRLLDTVLGLCLMRSDFVRQHVRASRVCPRADEAASAPCRITRCARGSSRGSRTRKGSIAVHDAWSRTTAKEMDVEKNNTSVRGFGCRKDGSLLRTRPSIDSRSSAWGISSPSSFRSLSLRTDSLGQSCLACTRQRDNRSSLSFTDAAVRWNSRLGTLLSKLNTAQMPLNNTINNCRQSS